MRTLRLSIFLAAVIAISTAPFIQAQESDVLVTKSGPEESAADTDVSYSVGVTNLGPDPTATLTLTDAIPSGMTFVSAVQNDGPAFVCASPNPGDSVGTISCSIPTLAAGSAANFTFVFHIPPATPPGTPFTNIANVATVTDPNSENDSAAAGTVTPFPPQGDLFVMKDGPAGAGADSDVVYTITIGNAGPDDASTVALDDTLPGTMTFVSLVQNNGPAMICSTPAVGAGGTVSCTAATFPAGASATFTLTGHIPAGTPSGTSFNNTATVTSSNDPNSENDSSSTLLIVSSADVAVVKSGPPTVTAGNNITYTITVSNGGPDTALDVTLDDPLPPDTTFVSLNQDSGPTAACAEPSVGTNGTVSCTFAALGNGVSAQFTLVVEAGNTLSVSNTATVSTTSADSNQGNNTSATVTTAVAQSADISVIKNGPTSIDAGSNITYNITVTNNGPTDATTVSLTDSVPANTTFVSAAQNTGLTFSCVTPAVGGTGLITCTLGIFPAGSSATFTFVMNVSPAAPNGSSIVNTADVTAATTDPTPGNNSSTTTAVTAASTAAGIPTLSPLALALMALSLVGIVLFIQRQ